MRKIEKKYIKIKIRDLKEWNKNPKKHDVALIKKSIEDFGYIDPIIIDEDNRVLSGHGRLKVLKSQGVEEADVVQVRGLTEEEKEKYSLIVNKTVEKGGWDTELLAQFDEELLEDVGFDVKELDNIFGFGAEKETKEEFDIRKEINKILKQRRRVQYGDLWQLGEHRLLIGDATKREDWEKLLGDEKFDFCFTDPPYFIQSNLPGSKKGFGGCQRGKYLGVEKKFPDYNEWLLFTSEFRNPDGASIIVFENWKNLVSLWIEMEKFWEIRNLLIWHTPNRTSNNYKNSVRFFNKYDIMLMGSNKGKLNFNNEEPEVQKSFETALFAVYGKFIFNQQKNRLIWDIVISPVDNEKSNGQGLILGTKPLNILIPYIKILSPRNGIVVDCFGGSGSTLIACEIMKRKCRMMEIEPLYGEIIINRWEKFTGGKAEKIWGKS